jgi:hypothetical protein
MADIDLEALARAIAPHLDGGTWQHKPNPPEDRRWYSIIAGPPPWVARMFTHTGGHMAASWKPEVIADSSGQWCGNGLRFATKEEAEKNVSNLASRWMMVQETRVVESDDPVNYRWVDGQGLVAV